MLALQHEFNASGVAMHRELSGAEGRPESCGGMRTRMESLQGFGPFSGRSWKTSRAQIPPSLTQGMKSSIYALKSCLSVRV